MYKYHLMYKGEVIATAESRDEAERLKGMYQMDYGPEIDIKKDSEMSFVSEVVLLSASKASSLARSFSLCSRMSFMTLDSAAGLLTRGSGRDFNSSF